MPELSDTQIGEEVLDLALSRAIATFGSRLEAAYALGSLAHGGFSSLVSDVDLGFILSDPLTDADAERIRDVGTQVRETGIPLADRLSVFWGSRQSLMEGGTPGRFPPLDRLDLIRHGRLLHRRDMRDGLPSPTHQELVIAAARMCIGLVERNNLPELVRDPAGMLAKGPRSYTKTVLFPVRFLYTARTGEIGRNHDAAEHMVKQHPGSAADLAGAALRWRTEPAAPDDARSMALLRDGLIPLYLSCLEVHADLARSWGEDPLAEELSAAHDKLKAEEAEL
jgi:hypothetical protein